MGRGTQTVRHRRQNAKRKRVEKDQRAKESKAKRRNEAVKRKEPKKQRDSGVLGELFGAYTHVFEAGTSEVPNQKLHNYDNSINYCCLLCFAMSD